MPGTIVFVLREREVRTDAHLAHTRLDVAVVWRDRVPFFVSHELRCDEGADFGGGGFGKWVGNHILRIRDDGVHDVAFEPVADATHPNHVALHCSHGDRVVREGDGTAVVLLNTYRYATVDVRDGHRAMLVVDPVGQKFEAVSS